MFLEFNAPISEKPKELNAEISDLLGVCDVCFKMPPEDAESVLNGFVSILVCKTDNIEADYKLFCERLESATVQPYLGVAFNVLYNFYEGLADDCPNRVDVFCSLLRVAAKVGSVPEVFQDVSVTKKWLEEIRCPVDKARQVYRNIHSALGSTSVSDMPLRVMVELLSTYQDHDAAEANQDAIKCIAFAISDPNTYLMDHLIPLKPIKALENQPINELLKIFVYGKLSEYREFYRKHKEVVEQLGLDHEKNVEKMRYLTFMYLAEKNQEISFDDIKREVEIDDVEGFTINVLRTKLVTAKVNQPNQKVIVVSTMHRSFMKNEWEQLREILSGWYQRLEKVEQSTQQIVQAQQQMAAQQSRT
ncbi:eukaryotic translation initiation factor 3 subunit M-like isoform X2 [Varroa jacobsoni]|nr:eukaryotic translation initiation factor 3 subunit M-like isoform X2 [Varroa jacobsoni]